MQITSRGRVWITLLSKSKNLDRALEEAAKAGYPVVLDMKGKTSRWAYIEDPNGIYIELFRLGSALVSPKKYVEPRGQTVTLALADFRKPDRPLLQN